MNLRRRIEKLEAHQASQPTSWPPVPPYDDLVGRIYWLWEMWDRHQRGEPVPRVGDDNVFQVFVDAVLRLPDDIFDNLFAPAGPTARDRHE